MTQEGPIRHRGTRRESAPHRVWRQYRFELIGLIAIALGVFLVLERMNLRAMATAWVRSFIARLFSGFQQLDDQLDEALARLSLSDAIGVLLIVCAAAAILWRIRWRLLTNPALTATVCPKCDGTIHRIHRKPLDRLISVYVPVRRYCCHDPACGWRGLRVGRHQNRPHRTHSSG